MIHYLKDLNSVCNFNETPEMNEDLDEEIEEFVEMNEIIITKDDADGHDPHDDDNNDNDNDSEDDYVDDTSPSVYSVCDQQIDNNNNKKNINNLLSRLLTKEGKNIAVTLGETANHHKQKIIFLDKCNISLKKTPENDEKYNNYINFTDTCFKTCFQYREQNICLGKGILSSKQFSSTYPRGLRG